MSPGFLTRPDGERLAYQKVDGRGPGILWLSGFKSDMTGNKVRYLTGWARREGRSFLAFDYFGHGQSSGEFIDGTIGRWKDDTLAVLDALTDGPQVLVGSSMGGWMALLAALARPDRIKALVLLAPAPDFTEDLAWDIATPEIHAAWREKGVWLRPSQYGDPIPYTLRLIEEGRSHLLLRAPIAVSCAVHILHGMQDAEVPCRRSLKLAEQLESTNVLVEFIKCGDHRLSAMDDLKRLARVVAAVADG